MRTLMTIAALVALTSSAMAGVLPVSGSYCGSGDNADIVLDADGFGGNEDGCLFTRVLEKGKNWWVVGQECSNTDDTPMTRIKVSASGKTITVADWSIPDHTYDEPVTLRRCRDPGGRGRPSP